MVSAFYSSHMNIRRAQKEDEGDICSIDLEAFPAEERDAIADLSAQLLGEASTPETINLVADEEEVLLGHVTFSPIFRKDDGSHCGYVLAPLAVKPSRHGEGIGSQLVRVGIEEARRLGAIRIFVYGDPAYYSRFGFSGEAAARAIPPFDLAHPFGWQGMEFASEAGKGDRFTFICLGPLNRPELW